METKNITIFSQRMAGFLMLKGFILLGIGLNKNTNDGKNVFYFKDSPELHKVMMKYTR